MSERIFITDTVEAELCPIDGDGERVEFTDDFTLDETTTVQIENEQWIDAFGTDSFYRFEPVVARPIDQEYTLHDEDYVFRKDESELKQAQWQIDNLPWTMGHPAGRKVTSTDDVRGFWRQPTYEDGTGQRARLYVPDNDDEALQFISENPDLSPGFGCTLDWVDDSDVDAVQREMLYDHIASVAHGRCTRDSDEGACGLQTTVADDAIIDGHAVGGCTPGECSCGLHEDSEMDDYDRPFAGDGSYDEEHEFFTDKSVAGVTFQGTRHGRLDRSEIPNDGYESHYLFPAQTKGESDYPVVDGDGFLRRGNVQSAWRLGARGGVSGKELDAKLQELNDEFDDKPIDPNKFNDSTDTMTDSDTDENGQTPTFSLDDMSAEVVIDQHDGVAETIEQKEATIESLKETKADLEDEVEDLRSFKESKENERREDLVDEITDITDYWDEDVMLGDGEDAEPTDAEILEERLEALTDAAVTETTQGDASTETVTDDVEEENDEGGLDLTSKGTVDLRETAD